MEYKEKAAKLMAESTLSKINEDELKRLAKEEKKMQIIIHTCLLIFSIFVMLFAIITYISLKKYIYYIVLTLISSSVLFVFSIIMIVLYNKKTDKQLVFNKLYRKYVNNPKSINIDNVSRQDTTEDSFKEVIIPNGVFYKDKIVVNTEQEEIYFINSSTRSKTYKYSDILKYEVLEDGESVVKGSAGRAMIGGLFFGLTGAVVGSAMSRKIKSKCTKLNVLIYVNDIDFSTFEFKLLQIETNKNSVIYENAVVLAKEICGILEYVMNKKEVSIDNSDTFKEHNLNGEATEREQLLRLKSLLDEGLITQEDFEQKKKQILGL